MYGGDIGYRQALQVMDMESAVTVGVQSRVDNIHAQLGPQTIRNPLGTTLDTDVLEASYSPFVKLEVQPLPWLRVSGGVRSEVFTFDVRNRCQNCPEQPFGRTTSGLVLPKANLILGPWFRTELFANYGEGFHSNDARSAVTPGSAPLARAKTYEVGARTKPWGPGGVELIATLWAIDLKSELVFVGDEGTTEIRGATQRREWRSPPEARSWGPLYFNGSVTWSHAEFKNGDAIPLAPELTGYGALILRWPEGLTSQLQATYLGVRPLIEDRSVKSPSWLNFELSERYQIPVKLTHGRLEAFLFIQNV